MLASLEKLSLLNPDGERLQARLQSAASIGGLVLAAWQIGLWVARAVVHEELEKRAIAPTQWGVCPLCGHRLRSKGFVQRQLLTLVGLVKWRRRVGRCPQGCPGRQRVPLDDALGIAPYQQTSTEVQRLGCLLAVLLPYDLAAWLLGQLSGIRVSGDTLWQWVQVKGKQAVQALQVQLSDAAAGQFPKPEPLLPAVTELPLVIAADGVKIAFRPQPGTPRGKRDWREVKIAVLARLGHRLTRAGKPVHCFSQRRLVAVLGNIEVFQAHLSLETHRQSLETAPQVIWLSDGARGFWGLFERCFADCATGILDFYHAASYLWTAAITYQDGNPARTPQMWFERLRYQLRHGFVHRIIKELNWLSKRDSTAAETKPVLEKVRDYLITHREHMRYRQFKKQGFPLGSGIVESACMWFIQQRFKGSGMRWSEDGFNHLLQLRLAWTNHRFDALFSDQALSLPTLSPNG